MFVAGVQRSRATGINGNPSIPLKTSGITFDLDNFEITDSEF